MVPRKPILWAFSISRLRRLFEEVIPDYASQADIRIIDKAFGDALQTAAELMRSGEVDVFVSAGANGDYLRQHTGVPVVLIRPSGLDLFQALARARRMAKRIAVITYDRVPTELDAFARDWGVDLELRSYRTAADAEQRVRELAGLGIEAVVGPGLVTDLAEQAGMRTVFVYSRSSMEEAIERAIDVARIAHAETARRERTGAILRHLDEGVVAVDRDERIEAINPAMVRFLGVREENALGMRLSAIAPALSLRAVLDSGQAGTEEVVRHGSHLLIANRIAITEQGQRTGAVLTCQDANVAQRVDRSLRTQHRPQHFIARRRLDDLLGNAPAMAAVRELAVRYARSDATVLIDGESGTGKELVAQGIHNASARKRQPFVAINCAALPESLLESELFGYEEGAFTGTRKGGKPGLFEAAHTGTLFLDEIGDLPLGLQAKLLRLLQEREVLRLGASEPTPIDVRVIAATHRDLRAGVRDGTFREDFFYRLHILHVRLPALRARSEDIEPLMRHLLREAFARHGNVAQLDTALAATLPHARDYGWPGNVREMQNIAERLAVSWPERASARVDLAAIIPEWFAEPAIAPRTAPPPARNGAPSDETITAMLRACNGNQAESARRLGIGRTTLWRRLKAMGHGPADTAGR